jgi:hypothetical protein
MYVYLRIKLTSRFMGSLRTDTPLRKLNRPPRLNGEIETDTAHWNWAVQQAASNLKDVDPASIRVPASFQPTRIEVYQHNWTRRISTSKMVRTEVCSGLFESLRPGAVLTLPFMLVSELAPEDMDSGLRPATAEEFMEIMKIVGEMLGISPWGSRFGFGRFRVLAVLDKEKNILHGAE